MTHRAGMCKFVSFVMIAEVQADLSWLVIASSWRLALWFSADNTLAPDNRARAQAIHVHQL